MRNRFCLYDQSNDAVLSHRLTIQTEKITEDMLDLFTGLGVEVKWIYGRLFDTVKKQILRLAQWKGRTVSECILV